MPGNYVALFRGVNVGGKNRLPMSDLASMFKKAGCSHVQTYIQSGNVVFTAEANALADLPNSICATVSNRFGFRTDMVLRSQAELQETLTGNPFLQAGVPETELHVFFLKDQPTASQIGTLDPHRSPPDEFLVQGRNIYARLPNGMGRTKLSNVYFDSKLRTISTARNWRTVQKLLELMST